MSPRALMLLLNISSIAIIFLSFGPEAKDDNNIIKTLPNTAIYPVTNNLPIIKNEAAVPSILARPLFAADRRPAAAKSEPAVAAHAPPPRVTGILINGGHRSVIFTTDEGLRPVVAGVGDDADGYHVISIEAEHVTVSNSKGLFTLRPSFDLRPLSLSKTPADTSSLRLLVPPTLLQSGSSQSAVFRPRPPIPGGVFAPPAPQLGR